MGKSAKLAKTADRRPDRKKKSNSSTLIIQKDRKGAVQHGKPKKPSGAEAKRPKQKGKQPLGGDD